MIDPPSRAIIDLTAYAHNLSYVKERIPPGAGIIAVVKADAYGHGAVKIARTAIECGAAMLAVATVDEGVAMRTAGIAAPVLVMLTPGDAGLAACIEYELLPMISDVSTAERLGELARKANRVISVHCKIDTGMGRQGFALDSAASNLLYLTRVSHIDIAGICTHFPIANIPNDPFTLNQIRQLKHALRQLNTEGIPYDIVHCANSAAVVNYPSSAFDLVRVGLMTYGIWPSDDVPNGGAPLKPVLRWETHVLLIREVAEGSTIGYGCSYVAPSRMLAAVLPVGYADGYFRALSNNAEVLIRGVRCPVRGAVSMDQIVADVTRVPGVTVGDTATIIGRDGVEEVSAAELAVRAETIPYEILARIGPRVERVYIEPSQADAAGTHA